MPTATAAESRESARREFDAFLAACPSRDVFERISTKWVGLVVCRLAPGPQRFGEIQRAIAGCSQKMLTQTLRTLERDGLVTRTVTPSVPVRVDYELTPLGQTLVPVMAAMKVWAEAHITEIHSSRAGYDAGQEPIS